MDYSGIVKRETWTKIKEIIDEVPTDEISNLDLSIDGSNISIDFSIGNTEQETTGTVGYFKPAITVDKGSLAINYDDLKTMYYDSNGNPIDEVETVEPNFNVNQLTGDIPHFIQQGFNQIAKDVTIDDHGLHSKETENTIVDLYREIEELRERITDLKMNPGRLPKDQN